MPNPIWPHLPSSLPEPKRVEAQPTSLANALYPSLSPQQKSWDEWRSHHRQSLLREEVINRVLQPESKGE
jgi:hypothetical protein